MVVESVDINSLICNSAINENNCVDNGHDLVIPSSDGGSNRHTIDCGPKLANLRRYWRDYYVDSSRMATSSSSAEVRKLKFMYSEKATKFCEISTGTTWDKSKVEISHIFVAFSEYMNFEW